METLALPGRKTDGFLRMGMSKKLSGFGSGSRYITGYLEQSHFKSRMLENRNTIPKKNVTIEQ